MDIQKIVIYVAGFVSECGCEVMLMTDDQELAFNWTRENQKYGSLAVFRGLYQQDLDFNSVKTEHIKDHLADSGEVCGYDGNYTNLYLNEIEKMAA